jgi:gluconate 2-dehydrogenase gamma chain
MKHEVIGRRQALKYFSILAASAAGQEFLAGWLPSARAAGMPMHSHPERIQAGAEGPAEPYAPRFFSPDQYRTVEILTELIIPTDDQPGAREAQVARYIDFLVFSAAEYLPELRNQWTSGLTLLDQLSQRKHGEPFRNLSANQHEQLLTEMSLPESNPKVSHPGFEFYRLVKETTVEGFYTSKIGLLDVLGYQGRAYLPDFPGCTHSEHQS